MAPGSWLERQYPEILKDKNPVREEQKATAWDRNGSMCEKKD